MKYCQKTGILPNPSPFNQQKLISSSAPLWLFEYIGHSLYCHTLALLCCIVAESCHIHLAPSPPLPFICPSCTTQITSPPQRQMLRQELGQKASEPLYLLANTEALPALFKYVTAMKQLNKTFAAGLELLEGWKNPHKKPSTERTREQNRRRGMEGIGNVTMDIAVTSP
jgi:hypothetical protein